MSEKLKNDLQRILDQGRQQFKGLDTNGDGYLGSAERADALIKEAATLPCKTLQDHRNIYQNAYSTSTPPTNKELSSFLEKTVAASEKGLGGFLATGLMETMVRSDDPALRTIFPKGVEHSTPADLNRSSEALSAKAVRCGKAAIEELKR